MVLQRRITQKDWELEALVSGDRALLNSAVGVCFAAASPGAAGVRDVPVTCPDCSLLAQLLTDPPRT